MAPSSATFLSTSSLLSIFTVSTAVLHPQLPPYTPFPSSMEQMAGWTFLNFAGLPSSSYFPENVIFTGITVTSDKIFLATPRFLDGVPATLSWIPRTDHPIINHPLKPYPSWTWQTGHLSECRGFVSVFRTRLDACGRLWVMDSGKLGNETKCPPRLFSFDTLTGSILNVIPVPETEINSESLLTFLTFDQVYSPYCDDMTVYITDVLGYGIVAYDVMNNQFWRVEHDTFRFDPRFETLTINGESTSTSDGVIAMAVSYVGDERMLFYHSLSSKTMYAVPISALQKARLETSYRLPVIKVIEQSSQGIGMTAARYGTVFFSPAEETSVVAYNPSTGALKGVVTDQHRLQYISDMTMDEEGSLWLISNRFQSFANMTYDQRGINLRVMKIFL